MYIESTEVPCVNKSPSFGGVGQKGEVFTEEECEDKGKKQSPNIENTDKNGVCTCTCISRFIGPTRLCKQHCTCEFLYM